MRLNLLYYYIVYFTVFIGMQIWLHEHQPSPEKEEKVRNKLNITLL